MGFEFYVFLVFGHLAHRAGDDERGTGIINEDGIYLVHHGVVMGALHFFLLVAHHIVAEVVEAKLVVGAVGDVAAVGAYAALGVGLVLVYAVYRQHQEFKDRAYPLGVAAGQVIVDGDDVHALAGEGIQVSGQRCDQGFPFAGSHFRDFPVVKYHTADELYVVMHHVPLDLAAGGYPTVVPYGLVALDFDIGLIRAGGQVAVVLGGFDLERFVFLEAAGGFAHYGESFRQDFFQDDFERFVALFFQGIYARKNLLLVVEVVALGGFVVQVLDFAVNFTEVFLDALPEGGRFGAQLVVADGLEGTADAVDFFDYRHVCLHVAFVLGAKDFLQGFSKKAKHGVVYMYVSVNAESQALVFLRSASISRTNVGIEASGWSIMRSKIRVSPATGPTFKEAVAWAATYSRTGWGVVWSRIRRSKGVCRNNSTARPWGRKAQSSCLRLKEGKGRLPSSCSLSTKPNS